MGVALEFYSLPRQLQEHALQSNIASTDAPETWVTIDTGDGGRRRDRRPRGDWHVGGGGYSGGGDRTGGGGRGDRSDGGGRGRGGGRDGRGDRGGGRGGRGDGNNPTCPQPTRARYPERYGPLNGRNPRATFSLKKAVKRLGDLGEIKWDELAAKCGSTMKDLGAWPGVTCGICVPYACGECLDPDCKADHGTHHELPREWTGKLVRTLREAVDNM